MTEPKPRTGNDPDPWLAAALRHAPDAADTPPAALSEAILRAAHESAATAHAPNSDSRSPGVLLQLWSWLTQPAVATAFTTLVLATAIGVMWWDEAVEPRSTRPAPPPAPAVAEAPAAPPAEPPAAVSASPAARPSAQQEAPIADAANKSTPTSGGDAAAATSAKKAEGRGAIVAGRVAAPSPEPPRQQAASADQMPEARSDATAATAPSTPAAAAPMRARSAEPAAASGERAAAINEPAALFAAVREQPQRWRWQADGGAMRAVDAPFLRWWAELERATSTWSAQSPTAGSTGAAPALVLRAIDDASQAVTIRLEADSVQAQFASGAAWHATLSGADAEALRQTREQLAR
jgi:hypothetical protein